MKTDSGEDTHTPGPWKVKTDKEPLHPTTYEIRNHEGLLIASVNIGMFDVERNANLIASAPDMLKELTSLRDENRELRETLKEHLPEDCIQGYGEVKFCSYRNGEGWKCKHCTD